MKRTAKIMIPFLVILMLIMAVPVMGFAETAETPQEGTGNVSGMPEMTEMPEMPQGMRPGGRDQSGNTRPGQFEQGGDWGNMAGPGQFGGNQTEVSEGNWIKEYQTSLISIILLLLAFIFVKTYKRK